ncbi:hypothetical protein phiA829_090 [Aeromonas phage phiA8-29]|uniref:Uncharacterized protein n=1 Tax=Aeromonas phage phiA8-29 TaxID=1978922 RepID=A0A1W6DY32_9CAUD|nr:hypothetical protein HWB15_gp091 [Aeromonas phage phiA8-29]ARK07910.1 hypothetical protein phiA829_090 [Aeromonas phage phiA8-29]
MNDFQKFSNHVHTQYQTMVIHGKELFEVTVTGDELWAAYLSAFPEGTNPIFRERTEHDCSCCRNFIKNLGRVVIIQDGKISTVWEGGSELPAPYAAVAAVMDQVVRNSLIEGVYRSSERQYGQEVNYEHQASGNVLTWHHFHGQVADRAHSQTPAAVAGSLNSTADVFKRGLEEITPDSLDTVLGLIGSNALYRGEEFMGVVSSFKTLQERYHAAKGAAKLVYHWEHLSSAAARIRNTAIGTLLQDLSAGVDLETAVKSFEKKVAPENYKRTTALITPKMIENGLATLRELGLESAVYRRFAKLEDVTINNVLWANHEAQSHMRDALAESLMTSNQVKKTHRAARVDTGVMGIDRFMEQVIPTAAQMEVFVTNSHQSNFVSLTAPVESNVGRLFKWDNNFGWSYNGNVTDSIKDKVKRAGGNTNAKLRVSLAWFNPDDLDLHAECPDGHIHFSNKNGRRGEQILDVDMNAYGPKHDTAPVENLSWTDPSDGAYHIFVNQYNARTKDRPGFVIELETAGKVTQFHHPKTAVGNISCIRFKVKSGEVVDLQVMPNLVNQSASQEVWGVSTEGFVKVETLMLSPNHWDDNQIGNKHYLFMLQGCKNPEPTRGIYNEYLINELTEHRKVFEVLGAQTLCPVVDEQLSGIGFSSTRNDLVAIRVTDTQGSVREYNVQF